MLKFGLPSFILIIFEFPGLIVLFSISFFSSSSGSPMERFSSSLSFKCSILVSSEDVLAGLSNVFLRLPFGFGGNVGLVGVVLLLLGPFRYLFKSELFFGLFSSRGRV
jgi:hypothetical protein